MLAPKFITTAEVWRMVAQFVTLEAAEVASDKLKSAEVEVEITSPGGLSVIIRSKAVVLRRAIHRTVGRFIRRLLV